MTLNKARVEKQRQSQLSAFVELPSVEHQPKKKLTKRDTHKVYSFWANKEQIEVWKCYQEASAELEKAEDLGLKAITEYIKNHPLKDEELVMYNLKLKSKGLENSEYR